MITGKTKKPGRAAASGLFSAGKSRHRPTAPDLSKGAARHQSRVAELEAEIALLTSYASDTIYRLRYDNMRYDYISPAVKNLLGFSAEEMQTLQLRSLIEETRLITNGLQTVDDFSALEQKRLSGDVNKWQADYKIRTKDGRMIWISDVSYPWFDETGRVIGSIGSLRDVTDRVLAEKLAMEELNKLATMDALTNCHNRREFFQELEKELKRINRTDEEISILIVDVDHFKEVNDNYGHDAGDAVLVQMSDILKSCLRDTDMLARLGGEEFAILLPDTPGQGAFYVAERMRDAVLRHHFTVGDRHINQITISIGIATAQPGQEIDASEMYKLADTRLYIAKNTGRNQVSMDEVMLTH